MTTYYKAELRSVDAWKTPDGVWEHNTSYLMQDGLFFSEDSLTPRKYLERLRSWEYLNDNSKGKVKVVDEWPLVEIQAKDTGEPLYYFLFDEEGIDDALVSNDKRVRFTIKKKDDEWRANCSVDDRYDECLTYFTCSSDISDMDDATKTAREEIVRYNEGKWDIESSKKNRTL